MTRSEMIFAIITLGYAGLVGVLIIVDEIIHRNDDREG